MMTKIKANDIVPFIAIHPGELIKDELKAREMKQKELAMLMDIPASVLNDVIKGKRSLNAELAVLLEKALDIPSDYWMRLQYRFDIDQANIDKRIIQRKKDMEIWNILSKYVPIKIFTKLGLLNQSISENIKKIYAIFSISSVEELVSIYSEEKGIAYFKKSERMQTDPVNLFSWKYLAYYYSSKLDAVNKFNSQKESELIQELNKVFLDNVDTVVKTQKVLNYYGIKFIVLSKFDKTPIDGFSFWNGENPTIVLTLRLDKIDNFAFCVLHEVCHVFRHLLNNKELKHISIEGDNRNICEDEANTFAKNALIKENVWRQFMSSHSQMSPHAMQSAIRRFAKENKINEAIVFGLYQHEINIYSIKTAFVRNIN